MNITHQFSLGILSLKNIDCLEYILCDNITTIRTALGSVILTDVHVIFKDNVIRLTSDYIGEMSWTEFKEICLSQNLYGKGVRTYRFVDGNQLTLTNAPPLDYRTMGTSSYIPCGNTNIIVNLPVEIRYKTKKLTLKNITINYNKFIRQVENGEWF